MRKARFVPQADITVTELAQIVALVIAGNNHDIDDVAMKFPGKENANFDMFCTRYPDVLRHFEISEIEEADYGVLSDTTE